MLPIVHVFAFSRATWATRFLRDPTRYLGDHITLTEPTVKDNLMDAIASVCHMFATCELNSTDNEKNIEE